MMTDFSNRLFLRDRGLSVTTLDLLKTFALVFMVVDHLGYFFFPDDVTWRAIGRWCVPVWFFLAGYHAPRNWIQPALLKGGLIVACGFFIFLDRLFPLNALFAIQLVYLQISLLRQQPAAHWNAYFPFLLIYITGLTVLAPVTNILWDYGTLALLMGVWGFFAKERALLTRDHYIILCLLTAMSVLYLQVTRWSFTGLDAYLCIGGMSIVMLYLSVFFKPITYPGHSSLLLRLAGRYTLEFYVAHLVLFYMILYNL